MSDMSDAPASFGQQLECPKHGKINSITISTAKGAVLIIMPDGRIERGEGFASEDVASMQIFDSLSRAMPSWMSALRERAEKAEAELAEWKANPLAR